MILYFFPLFWTSRGCRTPNCRIEAVSSSSSASSKFFRGCFSFVSIWESRIRISPVCSAVSASSDFASAAVFFVLLFFTAGFFCPEGFPEVFFSASLPLFSFSVLFYGSSRLASVSSPNSAPNPFPSPRFLGAISILLPYGSILLQVFCNSLHRQSADHIP